MYKIIDEKFVKVEQDKKRNNNTDVMQKRISELERQIAELENASNNQHMLFVYMSDAELSTIAKEKGVSTKGKERREVIEELINVSGPIE